MKPDIHPTYVETQVTCTCGNTFTTRSTAPNGVIHADVCSACHPFYTGKQKILDTGGRVARFEKRYAAAAAGQEEVARLSAGRQGSSLPPALSFALTASVAPDRARAGRPSTGGSHVRVGAAPCGTEFAELERALSDPAVHADLAQARQVGRRYAELTPIVKALAEYDRLTDDLAAARELAADDAAFAAEATELERPAGRGHRAADPAARPPRPQRLRRRADRDQVRRGRRGVGAVRRRPAQDVLPLRRDPRLEGRGARRPGDRPRRLQVGHRRGQGPVGGRAGRRCRTAC